MRLKGISTESRTRTDNYICTKCTTAHALIVRILHLHVCLAIVCVYGCVPMCVHASVHAYCIMYIDVVYMHMYVYCVDHECFVYAFVGTICTLYELHWGYCSTFFIGSIAHLSNVCRRRDRKWCSMYKKVWIFSIHADIKTPEMYRC